MDKTCFGKAARSGYFAHPAGAFHRFGFFRAAAALLQGVEAVYIKFLPGEGSAAENRKLKETECDMEKDNLASVKEAEGKAVTYLLRCFDGSLYCGWTNHLDKRVKAHNAGKGAKYTRSRRPVCLVYFEVFETKQEAMRREAAIKKLDRQAKERLVTGQAHREGQGMRD